MNAPSGQKTAFHSTVLPPFSRRARGTFIDGSWYDTKQKKLDANLRGKKPDKIEIIFDDENRLNAAISVCRLWNEVKKSCTEKTFNPEKVFDRIALAALNKTELTLFSPWGVRPDYSPSRYPNGRFPKGSTEYSSLSRLCEFCSLVCDFGVAAKMIVMPADLYATEINGMCAKRTAGYFSVLRNSLAAMDPRGEFTRQCKPWSEIREENAALYGQLAEKYRNQSIKNILPRGQIERAISSAQRFNPNLSKEKQMEAAFTYLRERMCEAEIIDEKYMAIKVSCVEPAKDASVDVNLPRLYLMPKECRFPWLKPA